MGQMEAANSLPEGILRQPQHQLPKERMATDEILAQKTARRKLNLLELADEQVKLLERFDPEYRDRHIEADFTGQLVGMDTFAGGSLKGVGRFRHSTTSSCPSSRSTMQRSRRCRAHFELTK
jgi:hypothetical protein